MTARSAIYSWHGANSAATASLIAMSLCGLLVLNSNRATAQISELAAAQAHIATSTVNAPPPTFVVGFVGGYVHKNDQHHSEVQLAHYLQAMYGHHVKVQVFKNGQRAEAHKAIVDWVRGTKTGEKIPKPNIILYGHSWGASAVVYLARELDGDGIRVALTIQVDSVQKNSKDDSVIPPNVAEAVNFYQRKGIIHGQSKIIAADPSRTEILGNFRFAYKKEPAQCHSYPWYDRFFFKGHTSIECDPRVWSDVATLIQAKLTPTGQREQTEVAARLTDQSSSR